MKKRQFLLLALLAVCILSNNPSHAAVIINPVQHNIASLDPNAPAVKAASEVFKELSRKEKKERIKEIKNEVRKFKAEKKSGFEPSTNTLLLVILAILLPPLAVYLHQGDTNNKFWISLILTLLFWIPGVIYSLIVVLGADK